MKLGGKDFLHICFYSDVGKEILEEAQELKEQDKDVLFDSKRYDYFVSHFQKYSKECHELCEKIIKNSQKGREELMSSIEELKEELEKLVSNKYEENIKLVTEQLQQIRENEERAEKILEIKI